MQDDKVVGKNSQKNIRTELIALGLLLPLVIVLAAVLFRLPKTGETPKADVVKEPEEIMANEEANEAKVLGTADNQQPVPVNEATVNLEIIGSVGTKKYVITAQPLENVAQILTRAAGEGLDIKTKNYGGTLGIFVESIDGIDNNTAKNLYWQLYINDQLSPVGASAAVVSPGDKITWKYEAGQDIK